MADDLLTAVTKAIITRLHTAGVGDDTSATGTHNSTLPRLTAKIQPPDPDRLISVTAYSRTGQPDPKLANREIRFQLMIRGGVNALLDPESIASAAFDALNGQHHVTWGGLSISRCAHSFGAPMGPDDRSRFGWSDNYTVVLQQRSTP